MPSGSSEENEVLTRIGPGTPMGELMRRYWQPAALAEELQTLAYVGGTTMGRWRRLLVISMAVTVSLMACAPSGPGPGREEGAAVSQRPAARKSITAAVATTDPAIFRASAGGPFGGSVPGVDALEDLVNAGATVRDDADVLRPQLAESLPTLENGLWKLHPDGRMETTWRIKPNAKWQDGAPFSAADLVFTLKVSTDPDMLAFGGHVGFEIIESVETADARTITVRWRRPFIEADTLFTTKFAMPVPPHLLERAYTDNREGFMDLPYWNREFVGAGPFKVRDWVDGSHLVLGAFEDYVLGRPKIDEIVVKFVPDPNTLVANLLASEVDINLGRGISLEQGIQVRDQWREGKMDVGFINWVVVYPQFINPNPPIIGGDPRFRKALLHAMDRQEMADTLHSGLTPVGHAIINTSLPQYRELDPFVVRYDFDPRHAGQLLEALGYVRGADGAFRDSAGQRLVVEIRTTGEQDIQVKSLLSVADYWQRAGVGVDTQLIPRQRQRDREYRASRPGFELLRTPDMQQGLRRAHSSETPLPENNFGKSGNNARYVNPEFDALLDRYFATIPTRERLQVLAQILRHQTDVVTVMGLFYAAEPALISNRLHNAAARKVQESTTAWNAHEWELR